MNNNKPIEVAWSAPWKCPWTDKQDFTLAPDYSGLDPDTGEAWSPIKVVKLMGLVKASFEVVEVACQKVINNNIKQVESYKLGKKNLIGFFIKLVMDETNRQADPKTAKDILEKLLEI